MRESFCLTRNHDSVVQSLSHVLLFATPWIAERQASLSFTTSWNLLKLMSIELMMTSNQLILCHPLLLLPSIFASIRDFFSKSVLCIRWPNYWSFSFSINPSSEYSGLISFTIDQSSQESSPASQLEFINILATLWCNHSALFMVKLSHPYMTTGKIISLTIMEICWQSHIFDVQVQTLSLSQLSFQGVSVF